MTRNTTPRPSGPAPRAARTQRVHGPRQQRGAALLLAMLVLTLVATITAGMVWQQSRAVQVEAAERARTQAAWIISGALDWARLILREDLRTNQQRGRNFDSLDEPWATPLAEARLSTFLAADKDNNVDTGPEAFLSGAIVDAQSRYNLRNLIDAEGKPVKVEVEALALLCATAGLPGDCAERITAGLRAAWRPANDDELRSAALPPASLDELVWVGIDAGTIERLAPWVVLLPVATPVNVNTAPAEVLLAAIATLDKGSAARLVQQRQRKPFENLDQVHKQLAATTVLDARRVGVSSNFFEVQGRLRLEERVLEERSLLERRGGDVLTIRRERVPSAVPAR